MPKPQPLESFWDAAEPSSADRLKEALARLLNVIAPEWEAHEVKITKNDAGFTVMRRGTKLEVWSLTDLDAPYSDLR